MAANETSVETTPPVRRITVTIITLVSIALACIGLILVLFVYLFRSQLSPPLPPFTEYIFLEIGKGLLIGAITTGVLNSFLVANYKHFQGDLHSFLAGEVKSDLREIRNDIKQLTRELYNNAASLEALRQSQVRQIYPSRESAIPDMARSLMSPGISKVSIIGISLNDFLETSPQAHGQPSLHAAWLHLAGRLEQGPGASPFEMRVMLIDPNCYGAILRARGETRDQQLDSRLVDDVTRAANSLYEIQATLKQKRVAGEVSADIMFEARLYQLPPVLFLSQTNEVTFTHQYYFWRSRDPLVPIPTSAYTGSADTHRGMADHFDWIWKHASISLESFKVGKEIGIESNAKKRAMSNFYHDPSISRVRILRHIQQTKRRLYIQGISLKLFFESGEILAQLSELSSREDVDIKILVIDPDSEQAKYRSFREWLITNRDEDNNIKSLADYCGDPTRHQNSDLVRDTNRAIQQFKSFIRNKSANAQMRKYSSSPAAFILMTDEYVMIEQYHYGKINPEDIASPLILGKDMPLVEYSRMTPGIFEGERVVIRDPYRLIEDHFKFAFEHGQPV
jgi:hypothetical protein